MRSYNQQGKLVGETYEDSRQQKKAKNVSLRATLTQGQDLASEQEYDLGQRMNQKMEAVQYDQLIKQLDQWTRQAFRESSQKTK